MTAAHRWAIVGLGVVLLLLTPIVVRAIPVDDRGDVSAVELLDRVRKSRVVSFTGYAETVGNVALPDNDALESVTSLYGDTHRVRVWWQDPQSWRVTTVRPTGETALVHRGNRMVRWVYESTTATIVPDVPVRLPITTDMLPPERARWALAGATAREVTRLPARRVAGREALGLRLEPAAEQAGIGRVDVWADVESGVPLSVAVYARGADTPALSARFLDFELGAPPASVLRFAAPEGARVRRDEIIDLASAADRFASRVPPEELAGLPLKSGAAGSVGVYGRGPTELLAVPLWERSARRVSRDLEGRPRVRAVDEGLLTGAPPLGLLLGEEEPSEAQWLLIGTVTEETLRQAARELAADRPGLRGQPR